MMIPKWFDKSPDRSNEQNIDDLRASLTFASEAYTSNSAPRSAFGHASFHYRALLDHGAARGLNALTASYGAALVDRAMLDALCRMRDVSIGTALWLNLPGLGADLTPDLAHFDFDAFLASLPALTSIDARHTVGMMDPLTADEVDARRRPTDGLPVALTTSSRAIAIAGSSSSSAGDVTADIERLVAHRAGARAARHYRDHARRQRAIRRRRGARCVPGALLAEPRLRACARRSLYLEQPLPRADRARRGCLTRCARRCR